MMTNKGSCRVVGAEGQAFSVVVTVSVPLVRARTCAGVYACVGVVGGGAGGGGGRAGVAGTMQGDPTRLHVPVFPLA